jgi:hypothetical protein
MCVCVSAHEGVRRGQVGFDPGLGLDPAHFLRPDGPGARGAAGGGGQGVTFGRTVVIECDGRAAAEVLEVVVP